MEKTFLNEAAWQNMFPHRVIPMPDEWLPGLLLRCDEVNHWGNRTTLTHLLAASPEKFHRCWRTANPYLVLIQPSSLNLDYLAQRLSIPTTTLLTTTYHSELLRLYDKERPHPRLLRSSFTFHLCPICLSEARILRRTLALPHITHCPQHQVTLLSQCRCGASLQLFQPQTRPFTCHICGLDWAELAWIGADLSRVELERSMLTWYEFFFSRGSVEILRSALQLMTGSTRKRIPLSELVTLLAQRGRSPQSILDWTDRAARLQKRKLKNE
ncbi:hypothetical protein KSF_008290 [Reticulibacter mediterranei]|uniref:TniQ domain-containing protein n=1 Tax=Reticulibacter mediterranei TaxID=2778369 RepID=A0A8J3IIC8_9CHLR|nr:TniQ family protein [Reticulibacter mediterranei]GHO90781.1 hypothetical protein KSF_008290 [Reticulibacter mediterranei]